MLVGTSERFQKLYENGKLDASLSLEVEVNSRFILWYWQWTRKSLFLCRINFRKAIRQFSSDADITERHLDLVKSEIFGEFFSSMNSLDLLQLNTIRWMEKYNFWFSKNFTGNYFGGMF